MDDFANRCKKERVKSKVLSSILAAVILAGLASGDYSTQIFTLIFSLFAFLALAAAYNSQAIAFRVYHQQDREFQRTRKTWRK